jgi:polysaccharide biosynthesis protein PelB
LAKRDSYSVAPNDAKRSRILSWGALGSITLLAIGALVLVFPKSDLMTLLRDESNKGNRDLSIAYLRNIIRTEPKDLGFRLLLVEKLLDGEDIKGARKALADAKILAGTTSEGQAAWDRWDAAIWQTQLVLAQKKGDFDETREAVNELIARLERSAASVTTAEQVFSAINSAQFLQSVDGVAGSDVTAKARAVERALLERLLRLPLMAQKDFVRGATMALGDGYFQLSSDLWIAARRKTLLPEERFKLLQKAVGALLAGGQSRAAWLLASKEFADLPTGDAGHWWLADLALGAGEPREAGLSLRRVWPDNMQAPLLAKTLSPERIQLAWSIFVSAGDLPDALLVADAALLTKLPAALWLDRKAQAQEWAGQADKALATWLALMKIDPSPKVIANVFRLSPMLSDDDALLAAWLAQSRKGRLGDVQISKVLALYERMGLTDKALAFIQQQTAAAAPGSEKTRWQLLQAALLERAGRPAEAITLLEALRPHGLPLVDAKRLANLQLRAGKLALALQALQAAQRPAGGFDEDYWDMKADIAFEVGERQVARAALDEVVLGTKAKPYQAERAIRLRLDADEFAQAALLAEKLYPRFPQDGVLYAWLDALSAQKEPTGLRGLLAALQPTHRARLEKLPAFLNRRAELYVRLNEPSLAKLDYQRSLLLQPANRATRIAYFWLLIDSNDTALLRTEVVKLARSEQRQSAFVDVMTAAWQVLDEPKEAFALMQRVAQTRASDFLWLMNYADVLGQLGRDAAALRVRRHAWGLAQQAAKNPKDREHARQALIIQLRLADSFAGGEEQQKLWWQLGKMLTQTTHSNDPTQTSQARELVTAWLLSQNRFDTAQRWLWQQHAMRLTIPAYQTLSLALAQSDTQMLAQMLDADDAAAHTSPIISPRNGRLAAIDRLSAVRALQRRSEAATLGFERAMRQPNGLGDDDNGGLQQAALQQDLLTQASRASLHTVNRRLAALTRLETGFSASIAVSPRVRFTADYLSGPYFSLDPSQIEATPARDNQLRLGLDTTTPWGDLKAQWLVRDALARVSGFQIQHTQKLSRQASLQLEAAVAERSDESSIMSIAGVRDRIAASVSVRPNHWVDGQASLSKQQFRTQTGAALGSSTTLSASGNWMLRSDYPDLRLKAQAGRNVMVADGQPDAVATALLGSSAGASLGSTASQFLGPAATTFGASLGLGLALGDSANYSRAWRPWGEVGFETSMTDTATQTQALIRLGIKGSVRGRDQLSLRLEARPSNASAVSGQSPQTSFEMGLRYEIFFDR